jgi:hypothetical protein
MRYCACSRSRLGTSRPEYRTTERPGHKAHSAGIRDRSAPRMERHRRSQPHVQKLLGPLEISRCEEWHTKAPLGIRRRPIKNSSNSSPSEQSERRADRTTCWTVKRQLGCQ